MQKFTNFLEKYVQWIAVALGIAWMGWVGYAYWATPPVSVDIAGQKLGPGDVDEFITKAGNPIDTIGKGLQNRLPIPKDILPKIDAKNAPQYASEFKQSMSLASLDGSPMRGWTPSVDFDPFKGPEKVDPGIAGAPLPVIPPGTIKITGSVAGQSFVKYADRKAVVKANDESVLVDPENPAVRVSLAPRELNWITVSANLDMKKFGAAFKGIPAAAAFTQILSARMMRQELQPDGTWSEETPVPDPANQFRHAWPPPAGDEELVYADWALKHVLDIIQPAFYEVQAGDRWHTGAPLDPAAAPVAPGVAPVDPNRPPVPAGMFNPANEKDQELWSHDETTVPGKIYRYKIQVFFRNPLFQTTGMAKNPADAAKFAIAGESDWTRPVKSPSREQFYVINGGGAIGAAPKVGVEYFWWEKGKWKTKSLILQPGDAVGATKWTVVDLRAYAAGDYKILFIHENGEIISRFYKTDTKDETYLKLKALLKAATPPAGASAAN